MRLAIFAIAALACTVTAQIDLSELPQIDDVSLPAFLWELVFMLIKFHDTESTSDVSNPTEVYQALDGSYAIDDANTVWNWSYETEEWIEFPALSGVATTKFAISLTADIFLYTDDSKVPFISLAGTSLELSDPSGSQSCFEDIATNALLGIYGLECTTFNVLTVELDTFLTEGLTTYDNQPASTPARLVANTFGTVFVVDADFEVMYAEDSTATWVLDVQPEGQDCFDFSVTLEGSKWYTCENADAEDKVYQKVPGHDSFYEWKKTNGDKVKAFHVAAAAYIDLDSGSVWYSDIFGLNKKIYKLLADYIDQALDLLPTDLPEEPVAP